MLVLGAILDQILDQSINEFHEQCEASIDDGLAKEPIDLRTKLNIVLIQIEKHSFNLIIIQD